MIYELDPVTAFPFGVDRQMLKCHTIEVQPYDTGMNKLKHLVYNLQYNTGCIKSNWTNQEIAVKFCKAAPDWVVFDLDRLLWYLWRRINEKITKFILSHGSGGVIFLTIKSASRTKSECWKFFKLMIVNFVLCCISAPNFRKFGQV